MRYITIDNLRPGLKLAKNLTMSKKTVLLRKGKILTPPMIRKIGLLGFQGLYIEDEISAGIHIEDVISNELRLETQNELQLMFFNMEHNMTSNAKKHIKKLQVLARGIVDEILHNRNAMVNLVDLRAFDDYTYSHSLNVTVLSVVIGSAMGLGRNTVYELAVGALVHDTGKMFIGKEILNKPGKLTPEEFEEIKKHSELGYQYLCRDINIPDSSKIATLHHHEQFNGNGYPARLSGESIPLFGRIISVADVYDALTSDRPYRKAMLPSEAVEYVMSGYGTMFDPSIVKAFTRKVAAYAIGTCVRLSSGDIGIVIKNYEETSLRPVVQLIVDNKLTNKTIDLTNDSSSYNITVEEIISL